MAGLLPGVEELYDKSRSIWSRADQPQDVDFFKTSNATARTRSAYGAVEIQESLPILWPSKRYFCALDSRNCARFSRLYCERLAGDAFPYRSDIDELAFETVRLLTFSLPERHDCRARVTLSELRATCGRRMRLSWTEGEQVGRKGCRDRRFQWIGR